MLLALGVMTIAYAAICGWAYFRQRSMMYYPVPEQPNLASEEMRLPVEGAVLKIWTLKRPGPRALIYFGGNAEDVGASVEEFARAMPHRSLYFVNYRGYGGSTGAPSETALVADALALFDRVRADHTDIAVLGRSLGSGVATQLAAQRPVSRLVLVTPFDSIVRVAQAAMRWLPVTWLLKDRYESFRFAPQVTCPTLVVIGAADAVIAPSHARALVRAFPPDRVRAVEIPGAGHNDIQLWPNYYALVAEFVL
jgi:pimeloyl-ACP methyl ester carboxylesterase